MTVPGGSHESVGIPFTHNEGSQNHGGAFHRLFPSASEHNAETKIASSVKDSGAETFNKDCITPRVVQWSRAEIPDSELFRDEGIPMDVRLSHWLHRRRAPVVARRRLHYNGTLILVHSTPNSKLFSFFLRCTEGRERCSGAAVSPRRDRSGQEILVV